MDAFINPQTRDYVLLQGAAQGDPAVGLANSIYLRLTVRQGSYWADGTFGSKLYLLARAKDVARQARLAVQYANDALSPLVPGRASAVSITSERQPGRLDLLIEVTALNGDTLTFKHPVQVI